MNKVVKKIYNGVPTPIRKCVEYVYGRFPYSAILGEEYRKTIKMLNAEEYKTSEEHEQYQFNELKSLLVYSYENIPYYSRIFRNVGFSPYNMKKCNDIEVIPFLTKELIEENYNDLISTSIDSKYVGVNSTSGTSGHQLQFAFDKRTYYSREWAFIHHLWKRIGYVEGKSSIAVLRNEVLSQGKLYEFDLKTRRLILDTYHLTDQNIEAILNKLELDKIQYIHTYPSAIMVLSQYIIRTGRRLGYSPKAIIVTSEMLYEGQKLVIESAFSTKVYTFYGHSERAALASWCECNSLYHIQSEYGYLELVDDYGKTIQQPNVRGEIICTGFNNYIMPLIRYKTADYSSYYKDTECECGRHYRSLNEIAGRWRQDSLIGKSGNIITDTALNMHSLIFHNVEKFQFIQNEIGKCNLLIVKGLNYSSEDEKVIINEVNKKVGDSIELTVLYVNDISRTKAGKYRYIIRNIDF